MIFTDYGIINDSKDAEFVIRQSLGLAPCEYEEVTGYITYDLECDLELARDKADEYECLYSGISSDVATMRNLLDELQECKLSAKARALVNELENIADQW